MPSGLERSDKQQQSTTSTHFHRKRYAISNTKSPNHSTFTIANSTANMPRLCSSHLLTVQTSREPMSPEDASKMTADIALAMRETKYIIAYSVTVGYSKDLEAPGDDDWHIMVRWTPPNLHDSDLSRAEITDKMNQSRFQILGRIAKSSGALDRLKPLPHGPPRGAFVIRMSEIRMSDIRDADEISEICSRLPAGFSGMDITDEYPAEPMPELQEQTTGAPVFRMSNIRDADEECSCMDTADEDPVEPIPEWQEQTTLVVYKDMPILSAMTGVTFDSDERIASELTDHLLFGGKSDPARVYRVEEELKNDNDGWDAVLARLRGPAPRGDPEGLLD